jgi:hypothetical protein
MIALKINPDGQDKQFGNSVVKVFEYSNAVFQVQPFIRNIGSTSRSVINSMKVSTITIPTALTIVSRAHQLDDARLVRNPKT